MANILVVDDDPICSEAVAGALVHRGRVVTVAEDGMKAVEVLDRIVPELVILDCALPKKSGIEVLRHMRNKASLKHVPVFLISSRQSEAYQQAMLAEGAQKFFPKPLDFAAIKVAVADLRRM
jgi:DNA-binding response OmpR family regulator